MRIPRFHCPAARRARPGDCVELDARESRHLATVLRRAQGDRVRLLPGDGKEWEGVIVSTDTGRAIVRVEQQLDSSDGRARDAESRGAVEAVIAVALARGGAFELALEHLAELGADTIIPLECERCVVRLADPGDREKKHSRWTRILEGAAKQSGRRTLPRLLPPIAWARWTDEELENPSGPEKSAAGTPHGTSVPEEPENVAGCKPGAPGVWIATPEDDGLSLFEDVSHWLGEQRPEDNATEVITRRVRVVCAIGPEGGFAPEEVRFALDRGARPAWLSDHVLRVPTAVAAAMTAIRLAILDVQS